MEECTEKSTITKEILAYWKKARTMRVIINKDAGARIMFFTEIKFQNERIEHNKEFNSFEGWFGSWSSTKTSKACFLIDLRTYAGTPDGIGGLLTKILKVGDKIQFEAGDNQHMYLKNAEIPLESWPEEDRRYHTSYHGLHDDTLFINIIRKGQAIVRQLKIASEIYPNNSSRPLRYNY